LGDLLEFEHHLKRAIAAFPPPVRAFTYHLLSLGSAGRAMAISELWADERSRAFAELLIDLEEDPAAKAFFAAELHELLVRGP
jgi:hypothetical protein